MTTLTSTPGFSFASARKVPALILFFAGFALFLGTGFAWPSAVHNATHDTRHALGLLRGPFEARNG